MSHISVVKTTVTDLNLLKAAAQAKGWKVTEKTNKLRGYFSGYAGNYAMVIDPGRKDGYQIGVTKNSDGTFSFAYDNWTGIKTQADELIRDYTLKVVENTAGQNQWWEIGRETTKDGDIIIEYEVDQE